MTRRRGAARFPLSGTPRFANLGSPEGFDRPDVLIFALADQGDVPSVVVVRNRLMGFQHDVSVGPNVSYLGCDIEDQRFTCDHTGVGSIDLIVLPADGCIPVSLWRRLDSVESVERNPVFEYCIVDGIFSRRRDSIGTHSGCFVNANLYYVMYPQNTLGWRGLKIVGREAVVVGSWTWRRKKASGVLPLGC